MKNGTYNCVVFFLLGVGLRIAIWCEKPWGRGQNTNATLQFWYLNLTQVNTKYQTSQTSTLRTRTEMVSETLVCSLFYHLNWLIARENFIIQNTTLHFGHLNLFLLCLLCNTHHTELVYQFEASDHYFELWASSWKGLVFPMEWFEVKALFTPCNPMH